MVSDNSSREVQVQPVLSACYISIFLLHLSDDRRRDSVRAKR